EKYTVLETEPVKLYRTISKISLGTVAIKNDKFPDAKIEIKRVFALRGAKSTYLAVNQKTKWGEIFDKDADNYFYGITDFDNVWTDEKDKAAYITGYEGETATYAAAYNFYDAAASSEEIILGGASSEDFPTEIKFTDEFYAFENTEAANWTLLVIHGDFSYMHIETDEDGNVLSSKLVTLENRYYTVRIGDPNQGADFTKIKKDDNFPGRTVHSGIMRNLHYQIAKITINGTGSTKILYQEDGDASLDVNVVVVDYGEVEQIWEF
ncbi:hypothetical protein LJC35_07895, partial [Parabacteroides sp. OttesenSCG-928-N08]|nr:hypothetical protein [Parabacteroides sp. OttesenSCG-928-N08]